MTNDKQLTGKVLNIEAILTAICAIISVVCYGWLIGRERSAEPDEKRAVINTYFPVLGCC